MKTADGKTHVSDTVPPDIAHIVSMVPPEIFATKSLQSQVLRLITTLLKFVFRNL